MNEMITKIEMSWCLNKFSKWYHMKHVDKSEENMHVDIGGLKG